jgi:two-component system, OmpR family, phosphate regulon sensor histidine kinase PhoR
MKTREKILIVDDEADIALILKLQLEDAGFLTTRARDGLDALEIVAREKFALILLDIKMPFMDGMQVLERLRRDYPETPVIMMTAHGSEHIAVEAMKQGASDYVSKPFGSDELLKNVKQVLQLARTRRENLRLQREVEEERKKNDAILQSMADLVVAVDEKGRIMTINHKAESVFGVARQRVRGLPVEEVVRGDIPPERFPCRVVLRTLAECLDTAYTLTTPEGPVPVLSSATPLLDNDGRLFGSVEVIRDISTLRKLEQEKEDFVSMLSHDLKSPITAVVGSIDLVREEKLGPVNGEQKEYLESAVESCGEMVEMIDNLLDVHRFQAGKMVMSFREEDPVPLVRRSASQFRPIAEKAGVVLKVTEQPLPPVVIDRRTFVRLINNLLSNALKFTDEGVVEVTLSTAKWGEMRPRIPSALYAAAPEPDGALFFRLEVRDTGVGISREELSAVFERFVQATRSTKGGGTGLGLTFCRKVMDAHGGYIWGESEPGKGSSFNVLFPAGGAASR